VIGGMAFIAGGLVVGARRRHPDAGEPAESVEPAEQTHR
jgi:hypothetical protein